MYITALPSLTMPRNYDKTRDDIEGTLVQVTQATKTEEETYRRFKKKLRAEQHLHQQTRTVLAQETEKQKESNINEFKARQQNIYEEKRVKLAAEDLAAEQRNKQELQNYRDSQEKHWKQQVERINEVFE